VRFGIELSNTANTCLGKVNFEIRRETQHDIFSSRRNFYLIIVFLFLPLILKAGGWTQPKSKLWIKSAVFHQSTNERFCNGQDATSLAFQQIGCNEAGHRSAFDPFIGGELTATAIYTELAYGITDYFEAGLQLPFYRIGFTNLSDPDRSPTTNFGDLRFRLKLRTSEQPIVSALSVTLKSPTGEFTNDAEIVNVSEGQWDIEFLGEISKSFWPVDGYAGIGIGYRIREDNVNFEQSVENEFILRAEAGYYLLEKLLIKSDLDWLRGSRPTLFAFDQPLLWRRELLSIAPMVLFELYKDFQIETGVRYSIAGEDYPSGYQVIFGFSYNYSIF